MGKFTREVIRESNTSRAQRSVYYLTEGIKQLGLYGGVAVGFLFQPLGGTPGNFWAQAINSVILGAVGYGIGSIPQTLVVPYLTKKPSEGRELIAESEFDTAGYVGELEKYRSK